jgi:transposase
MTIPTDQKEKFYSRRSHYDKATIKKSLLALEKGVTWIEVCEKYGMNMATLSKWIHKYGNPELQLKNYSSFTLLQRKSIVSSIERGLMTVNDAKLTYGIKGHDTIQKWIRAFKEEKIDISVANPVIMKKSGSPPETLPTEVETLQKALEDAQLKIAALNTLIDVAEEQIKIRKKPGAKQSPK